MFILSSAHCDEFLGSLDLLLGLRLSLCFNFLAFEGAVLEAELDVDIAMYQTLTVVQN